MAYTTIDDPSAYFDVTLWTGNGGARTISGLNHKPDLIWTKTRSVAYNHMLSDSSRGFNANSELGTNSTAAEGGLSADVYGYKSGHTADGWTMVDGTDTVDGQEDGNTNQPSVTYVGWTWAANGGTTASNTSGDITTTVQANTTAGFSIATYTGNGGSGQTLGHGLGADPEFVIFKDRDSASAWRVYTKMTGASKFLNLNTTDAAQTSPNIFPSVSSTTIGVEQNDVMNKSGSNHVMYSFRSIQGYSKIGSFTGNGSTDGPFVYTGFKPAWLMYKEDENAGGWGIWDNKRVAYNPINIRLLANTSAADDTSNDNRQDFLSNGFKVRTSSGGFNESGRTIYYMAFAEHPFVSSKGVPTTAR